MSNLILPANYEKSYGVVSFMAREKDGMIAVVDMWPLLTPDAQRDTSTVTKSPQVVLNELARRGYPINDRIVAYLDENEVWDILNVRNGNFDNFCVTNAPNWQTLIEQLLRAGKITRKDLIKAPVIDTIYQA